MRQVFARCRLAWPVVDVLIAAQTAGRLGAAAHARLPLPTPTSSLTPSGAWNAGHRIFPPVCQECATPEGLL